jgi:abortive infection bacteriophage resistance protein
VRRRGAHPLFESRQTNRFHQGTTFEDILNLYTFDRELRLLVLDAIERIEISIRAKWAYHLTQRHGAHAHLNADLFVNKSRWIYTDAISQTKFDS